MLELASLVGELVGGQAAVVKQPLPVDDPKQRRPDITRAKQLIDFEPRFALREGLERTIADFRARMGNGRASLSVATTALKRIGN